MKARVCKTERGWWVYWARPNWIASGRKWHWRRGPYRWKWRALYVTRSRTRTSGLLVKIRSCRGICDTVYVRGQLRLDGLPAHLRAESQS